MRKNDLLADDVDIGKLAALTKNYTGAEIEEICKIATSFALFKDADLSALTKGEDSKKKN
jgi:vesicle-fusing ATPase